MSILSMHTSYTTNLKLQYGEEICFEQKSERILLIKQILVKLCLILSEEIL